MTSGFKYSCARLSHSRSAAFFSITWLTDATNTLASMMPA